MFYAKKKKTIYRYKYIYTYRKREKRRYAVAPKPSPDRSFGSVLPCCGTLFFFLFSFHLPHCLHCSGAFSGHYTATRSCSRTYFSLSTTFSGVFTKPRNSQGCPSIKEARILCRSFRRPSSDGCRRFETPSPPLQAFTNPMHASCSCMYMVVIREEERLVRRAAFLHRKSRHRLRTNRCK